MSKEMKAPRPQAQPQYKPQQGQYQSRPGYSKQNKPQSRPQSRPNTGFNRQQMNREHRGRNMGTAPNRSRAGVGGGRRMSR